MVEFDKRGLDDLNERLKSARASDPSRRGGGTSEKGSVGQAMRVSVELVAGLVVGGGIGYLLDRWLGTAPRLMVVFFLLGGAAGMLNVYRAMAGLGMQAGYPPKDEQ
jgi:ATP synthase protein I